MKKEDFFVDRGPTPFKQMCDEHEISYKDIALSSGVGYHTIAKVATHAAKPTEEVLAKLNQVCEPIFGKTLTLEDFGFHTEPAELVTPDRLKSIEEPFQWVDDPGTETAPETETTPALAKKTTRKQTRKKGGRTKAKAVAKPKPEKPETASKAVTVRAAVEYLSSGFVLRDGDGWSECFMEKDSCDLALAEHIENALKDPIECGYVLEIKVIPVTNPAEFYAINN